MSNSGAVQFERSAQGRVDIVLLVDGEAVARSESPANIAAEVAFRDISLLAFSDSFVIAVPADPASLTTVADVARSTPEVLTACRLIAECAW